MNPQVITKTVQRHFVNGKGFSSKALAYKEVAKRELSAIVHARACEIAKLDHLKVIGVELKPYISRAYGETFPLDCKDPSHEYFNFRDWSKPLASEPRAYCNQCRWAWISARAKELRAEAERKSL